MAAEEEAPALAHYIWPPQWIGEPPASRREVGDVILSYELPEGIHAHAFRDGMIAFRLGPGHPRHEGDFFAWSNLSVRLMNAHLGCLHAALGYPPIFRSAVVTLWTATQIEFNSGAFLAMSDTSSGGTVLALHHARRTFESGAWDWRFERGGSLRAVPRDKLVRSFELLECLLKRPGNEAALLRAEMLLRSKSALMDQDPSGALTNAWTAIEGLLGDLLGRYLDQEADRPTPAGAGKFINRKRRDFFEGSEMTVRHVAEVLSLLDIVSFDVYQAILRCARARNNWLHTETLPAHEVAAQAITTCGQLFEQAEGIPLHLLPAA